MAASKEKAGQPCACLLTANSTSSLPGSIHWQPIGKLQGWLALSLAGSIHWLPTGKLQGQLSQPLVAPPLEAVIGSQLASSKAD